MKWLVLPLCICAMLSAADGITYEQGLHVTVNNGNITLSRLPQTVFNDHFTDDNWRICFNRGNALSLVHGERLGRRGLILSRRPDSIEDTAFELRSKAFKVKGKSEFRMSIFACGNWNMPMSAQALPDENMEYNPADDDSHGFFNGSALPRKYKSNENPYHSPMACRLVLRWLNARGGEIGVCPLKIKKLPDGMSVILASGIVPPKAEYGQILIGAESPDFGKGDYLMLLSANYSADTSRLFPSGSFISMPFPVQEAGAEIRWKAHTPGRSSVYVQLSTSPEGETWTPFSGAGMDTMRTFPAKGSTVPAYPAGHKWMRYKVILHSDGKNSPAFKSIKIGDINEYNWKGQDKTPPVITMINPARLENAMSALEFRIDDSSAVEWHTLEMKIDGRDAGASLKREGNKIRYTPERPFSSKKPDFNEIGKWKFSNRNLLLDKRLLIDGTLRISREGGEGDTFFELVSPYMQVTPFENYIFSCEMRSNMSLLKNGPKHIQMTFYDKDMKKLEDGGSMYFSGSSQWAAVTCAVPAPLDAAFLNVKILMEDPDIFDGRYIEFRKVSLSGKIEVPKETEDPNLHIISVRVADKSGNICERHFGVLFEKMSSAGADIDKNGTINVNGKKFIPVAMSNVWMRDSEDSDVFFDLSNRGFNMAIPSEMVTPEEMKPFAENAINTGIKSIVTVPDSDSGEILKNTAMAQAASGTIGWLFTEKNMSKRTPQELKELITAVKGIAPAHLVFIKGMPGDKKILQYAAAADVFMPVIRDKDDVCEIISEAEKAGCRSIMPVLSIGDTASRLLERTCTAFMCGVSGIAFECTSSETRKEAFAAAEKLIEILSIISAPEDGTAKYKADSPDVEPLFMSRRTGDRQYILFCNRDKKAAEVTFKVDDCDEARILFDGRRIAVGGRMFRDTVGPGELRIYELGRLFE